MAQSTILPNFGLWIWQSTVTVGKWLYIDSGEYYQLNGKDSFIQTPNNYTIAIDTTKSFSTTSLEPIMNSKPANMNNRRAPALFYSPITNHVLQYGGWADNTSDIDSLWFFIPDGKGGANWQSQSQPKANGQTVIPTFGAAHATSDTTYYSLGGTTIPTYPDLVDTPVQGLIDLSYAGGAWSNDTSAKEGSSGYLVQGQAEYSANFGGNGVLFFVGGSAPYGYPYDYQQGQNLVPMSSISVYDIASQAFYTQQTVGDIPPARETFCMAGVLSNDNSTFEIFVYGGTAGEDNDIRTPQATGFLDVYILSIPAFRWFKANATQSARRQTQSCSVIGNRTLLIVGGSNPSAGDDWNSTPDPWPNGLGLFDMTNLTWTENYDPAQRPYERPTAVSQFYANNSNPYPPWSDASLQKIFASGKLLATSSPKSTATTINNDPSKSGSGDDRKGSAHGLIIGLSVGLGVLLIGVIVFVVLCMRRRRRNVSYQKFEKVTTLGDNSSSVKQIKPDSSYELSGAERTRIAELSSSTELQSTSTRDNKLAVPGAMKDPTEVRHELM